MSKKNTLIKAVFTLTIFSLMDRILGFIFKIYLSHELGATMLGIYNVALSLFYVLLTLTTSGLPLIVSKFTATYASKKNKNSENSIVTAGLVVGIITSIIVCGIFIAFKNIIGGIFATKQSMTVLLYLLPGILFSGIYASFRGNLWGHQKYTTVSVIEVIEQIMRICCCLTLFTFGLEKLYMTALSMSFSYLITAVICIICYFVNKGKLASPKGYVLPVLKQATPITMIRASNTLVNSLISLAVPFLLIHSGLSIAESMYIYGASVGMAMPLLFIPITVVGSLAYVMIPTLSTAAADNDKKSLQMQIENAIGFSIVVAALFVPIFFSLGEPLGILIYDNATSGHFLKICAWLLVPMSIESISSSMMNSLDLEKSSFINFAIGSCVLFGIIFAFFGKFKIEYLAIGFGACWTISSILHIYKIKKKTGIKLNCLWLLLKTTALIFPSAMLIKLLYSLFAFMPQVLSILLSGAIGFAAMAILCVVFGVFDLNIFFSRKKKSNSAQTSDKSELAMKVKNGASVKTNSITIKTRQ